MRHTQINGLSALACILALAAPATAAPALTERETVTESFELPEVAGERVIKVDTVWGRVRISARPSAVDANRDLVEMTLDRRIEAPSEAWLERARREVKLEMFREPGTLELFVDGPWRSRRNRYEWADESDVEYTAIYDFELVVPPDTSVEVRTVLDGEVVIEGIDGRHDVSNVTGDVLLRNVRGSGHFRSVSGSVTGNLSGAPSGPSLWKSVSGHVEIALTERLDADLVLRSQWGEVWSEYPVEALPSLPAKSYRKNGKFVIKGDDGARFRVGAGGPELRFETLSGDIKVRKDKGD